MSANPEGMPLAPAVAVLHAARGARDVVVTSMGSAREWMALGPSGPLDLVMVPSSMGQTPSLALGIALAQPDRRVVVCSGDGSMLMNLGALVTIAAQAPANLTLIVFDNGVYEVTGGQPTPVLAGRERNGTRVDFADLARACGFAAVFSYSELGAWRADAPGLIRAAGPVCVILRVAAVVGAAGPRSPGPARERARKFMEALRA